MKSNSSEPEPPIYTVRYMLHRYISQCIEFAGVCVFSTDISISASVGCYINVNFISKTDNNISVGVVLISYLVLNSVNKENLR